MHKKIKTQNEIVRIVRNLRKQGKKIVTYNGSFDILHIGHVRALKEAKNQGEVLIVFLNSDKSVKIYKGPRHPIIQEDIRAEILASLECVDYVVLFSQMNPKEVLDEIKPDIHCNSQDWGKNCIEREVVEKNGGKIYILKWQGDFSTSNLIKNILDVYSEIEAKAVFLDRDGTINTNKPKYIHKIENFKFVSGAIFALKKLSKANFKIIVVTNQSGIARGYYNKKDLKILHNRMLSELNKNGVRIDKIYYCPHVPNDNCFCRKPKVGMLLEAVKDFNINLSKSWFIGDDQRDVIAGRNANIKTIKIGDKMPVDLKIEPNFYAKNLLQAVEIIFKNNK